MGDPKPDRSLTLVLTEDEALVFSHWLDRLHREGDLRTEDPGEDVAISRVVSRFEKLVDSIFDPRYGSFREQALARLRADGA